MNAMANTLRSEPNERALATTPYSISGAAFQAPGACSLPCTLTFGTYSYIGPTASFTTRSYSNSFPGPTITVSAGSTFQIKVVNALQDISNLLKANTTNVHTVLDRNYCMSHN